MSADAARRARACTAFVVAVALTAASLRAQDVPSLTEPISSVAGRVVLARAGEEPRPLAGSWVALNRVGGDSAGVLDSTRTAADGSYGFTFRRSGDPDAIYFTDVTYGGVAYFTDPFRALNSGGEEAELVVFDTASVAPGGRSPLRVRGRHFVVGPPLQDGQRVIVEVFELTNDTSLTILPRSDTEPVWSAPLLDGARGAQVGDGDVSASMIRFRDGRAELHAPIAPGLRQLSINYVVPASTFPLVLTLADSLEVLEVLVAGGSGTASGAGLHAERSVTIEEQPYSRFLSRQAATGDAVEIRLADGSGERLAVPLAIGLSVLAFGGALVHVRRTAYPSSHN